MPFTIATWNVLATAYIRPVFYPRTPERFLDPLWRVPALVAHAQTLDADLLCLQEVETSMFRALHTGLSSYVGIHALKGNKRPDGCAAFFRTGVFKLLDNRRVEYSDASGHVAQRLLLAHEGRRLAVVNTHLKWDAPGTPPDRQWGLGQIREAIRILDDDADVSDSHIICGDLNVESESDVIEALGEAGFDYAHRSEPGVRTCNSNGHAKLIDYLFWRGPLRAHPMAPATIDGHTPLPSEAQPSDHLPLLARFDWL